MQQLFEAGLNACRYQRWEDGNAIMDALLYQVPDHFDAKHLKACTLAQLGRLDESDALFVELKKIKSLNDLSVNHAGTLVQLGRYQEAIDTLDHDPFFQGTIYLGTGNYKLGWDLYRNRFKMPDEKKRPSSIFQLLGKRVFLVHEQGMGDTLQFMRYAELISKVTPHLILGVTHDFYNLYKECSSFEVFNMVKGESYPDHDWMIPVMDCPVIFETTLNTIPPPFAFADNKHHAIIEREDGFKYVGLIWAGGAHTEDFIANIIDKRRSMTFEQMSPLLSVPNIKFYSLQLDGTPDHPDLNKVLKPDFDFLETAKVIKSLDLVITIDSSVAHLAASMGKPTWLLSRFDGCWRWIFTHDRNNPYYSKTPWYPSMKIYRQSKPFDWESVIAEVKADLTAYVHGDIA